MAIQLEVGKTYTTRGGRRIKIIDEVGEKHLMHRLGYRFKAENGEYYRPDGLWTNIGQFPEDIVKTEPQFRKLTIEMTESGTFYVDEPAVSGSPFAGTGATLIEAVGRWFHNNQTQLGFEFDVLPSARAAEEERRRTELSKR